MTLPRVDLSQKDILIVDDTPDNLRVLSSMLARRGYTIRKALNGQMALTACQTTAPDLILLDIMMPGMDGYQVCEQLKNNENTRDIPIIFISALDDVSDKVKAFTLGGVDYITKPFQAAEVVARVENQLTIRTLHACLAKQNSQLQQLNSDLKRSNNDLEQFAYIASHDLQSPLAAITSLSELLELEAGDSLEANCREYIGDIQDIAANMRQLIQDLLDYSRAGRSDVALASVDGNAVLERVLSALQPDIEARGATVKRDRLPVVLANSTQLQQLFQNLLSNGLKFTRPDVPPSIEISTRREGQECYFSISDNGIGIDSENRDRIFQVFYRLHTASDYPGTGIGLAVCQKIVERHGGRIWVESCVGAGTTFHFTLRAAEG